MKIIALFLFIVSFGFVGFSQTQLLDSLQNVLQTPKLQDTVRISTLLNLSYAMYTNDSEAAEKHANHALEIATKIKWKKGIAYAYRQRGLIQYYKSDFTNALFFFQKSLNEINSLKIPLFEASVYNNIANIYADIGEFEKALINYQKLLVLAKQAKSLRQIITASTNIATVEIEQKNYKIAIEKLNEALAISQNNSISEYLPAILNNLSRAHQYEKQYEKALLYLNKGLLLAQNNNDLYLQSIMLRNMGEIYLIQNKLELAQLTLKNSIEKARMHKAIDWESHAWEVLSRVYEKQNNATQALFAYKKHIVLRDSVLNQEKKVEIIRQDLLFENEKNQALAKAEIKHQKKIKNQTLLATTLLVIFIIIGVFLYKRKRDALTLKNQAEFSTIVYETELKALRAQMNPHFIFNSLNSISDYISKNNTVTANKYLTKFAKLMRLTLENSEKKFVTIAEDIKLLELYMQNEAMRLSNNFEYTIKIDQHLDPENTLIPSLLLQPFIENSIWHGISNKKEKGIIFIEFKKNNNQLICCIEDNGVGRQKNDTKSHQKKSLGIQITQSRIQIINQLKNADGGILIFDKENGKGVCVEVKIPLLLKF